MLQTLASVFGDKGKESLKTLADFVQTHDGMNAIIEQAAREIVLKGDAEAAAELRQACLVLEGQVRDVSPGLSPCLIKGLVTAFGELIVARYVQIRSQEGRA